MDKTIVNPENSGQLEPGLRQVRGGFILVNVKYTTSAINICIYGIIKKLRYKEFLYLFPQAPVRIIQLPGHPCCRVCIRQHGFAHLATTLLAFCWSFCQFSNQCLNCIVSIVVFKNSLTGNPVSFTLWMKPSRL